MRRSSPDAGGVLGRLAAGDADGASPTNVNPFPGPRPFAESENVLFFGRDRELADLVALLFAQRAVLLHGPSGGGKSSLVHAGLLPRAQQRGFSFLPVARVRGITEFADDAVPGNRFVTNVIENWREAGLEMAAGCTTLAEAVSGLPAADEPGRVMVFDQFEELFVLHPERWRDRADLLSQIQDALDRDPLLHVLFVLRDDFLARLQPLAPHLRDRLSTRYHLQGLSSSQALDAVVEPFAATGRHFAPGVAEGLVTALRTQPADDGGARSYEGEDIEPVQLQIVCRTFFGRLPADVVEIGEEHVVRHADVGQALVGFYEQALTAAIKGRRRAHERKVRLWFEKQLITPARTRGLVFRDQRTTGGLQNEIVDELERGRVVRSEPRGPALWYELTHDRLIDAVLGSNRIWYAARARWTRTWGALAAVFLVAAVLLPVLVLRGRGGSGAPTSTAPQKASITVPGQAKYFDVDGHAGQRLTAALAPEEGFGVDLRLVDDQGATVGRPGPANASRPVLSTGLPHDGHYRIEARGRENTTGTFAYAYDLQTVDSRNRLAPDQPTPGAIRGPDSVDVYTFEGKAGTLAQIVMGGETRLYHRLVVVGPDGQGYFDEDTEGYGRARVIAVLPQDGTYEVLASSGQRARGSYRLDLTLPQAVDVRPGTVKGEIVADHRYDVRTIRSDVGAALHLTLAGEGGMTLSLLAADGRPLQSTYVGSRDGEQSIDWIAAPANTYLVVVSADSTPSPYSLSAGVEPANALVDGRALGSLERSGQVDVFGLDGRQGTVVSILVSQVGRNDLMVRIVEPDGRTLIQQDGGGPGQDENFTVQLRSSGPHLMAVSSAKRNETGSFALTVTQRQASSPG